MSDQKSEKSAAAAPVPGVLAPRPVRWGIYGTAFFSLSMVPMASILVPLWLVGLGATPLMIGISLGVSSLLP